MMHRPRKPYGCWALFLLVCLSLSGCAAFKARLTPPEAEGGPPPRPTDPPAVIYLGVPCYIHEVRWPEESLATVARWYTGSSRNARVLARITPNLRGGGLRKGDRIFVPQELARRNDPMPRSYAQRYGNATPPAARAEPLDPPSDIEDIMEGETPPSPYGPRTFPD